MKLGIEFWGPLSSIEAAKCASLAEKNGFESVWMGDGIYGDPFCTLAILAQTTKDIKLGTAVTNVFTRTPSVLAMTASTLSEISRGRFVLGLGTSDKDVITHIHGCAFEKPLTRVKETVQIIRQMLSGSNVTHNGQVFRLKNAKLNMPNLPQEVPIYLGGSGPNFLKLAGEIADGLILYYKTPRHIPNIMEKVRECLLANGRNLDSFDIAVIIDCCMAPDLNADLYLAKETIASTIYWFSAYYREMHKSGYGAEADAIRRALDSGEKERALAHITDEIRESYFVLGSEELKNKLREYEGVGVKRVILEAYSLSGDVSQGLRETIETVSRLK